MSDMKTSDIKIHWRKGTRKSAISGSDLQTQVNWMKMVRKKISALKCQERAISVTWYLLSSQIGQSNESASRIQPHNKQPEKLDSAASHCDSKLNRDSKECPSKIQVAAEAGTLKLLTEQYPEWKHKNTSQGKRDQTDSVREMSSRDECGPQMFPSTAHPLPTEQNKKTQIVKQKRKNFENQKWTRNI